MSRFSLVAALLFALSLASGSAEAQERGAPVSGEVASVSGTVRDAATGETLILASIAAEGADGSARTGAATNSQGFYVLAGLPPGEVVLVASYVGYAPRRLALTLEPGERRRFDFSLVPATLEGDAVVVEAGTREQKAVGVQHVPMQLIQQLPSTVENDLFRGLQLLPGVKAASDFSSKLYVRGGSPDQTLILLDQTTVYNPTHFFGFFSTFNTDAIKDVRVHKGGYPAEYGGRLGSVIDVYNRDGNRNRLDGKASVGLLASRVNVEGPLRLGGSRGSWFLAVRRSTLEPVLAALREREDFIPEGFFFYDVNAKVNVETSPDDRFSLALYAGADDVKFPFAQDARFDLRYGNRTGSFRYTRILSDRVFATLRLTGSQYVSTPTAEVAGVQRGRRNSVDDVSAKGDVEWLASRAVEVKGGFWGGHLSLQYAQDFDGREILASRTETDYASGYLQTTLRPSPVWTLTGGLRANYFSSGDYLRLEPRLQVERALGERVRAQAAYGRYYQFLALISNEAFSGFDVWVTTQDDIPPAWGDQLILGLKTRPLPNLGVDVEGYVRTLRDLFELDPTIPDPAGLRYADLFRSGDGYATGLEVLVERPLGRLHGFVSYTLGLTQRRFTGADGSAVNPGPDGRPQFFSPKYDRRHDVAVVANLEVGRGWTVTGAFVYATGQAYTRPTGRTHIQLPLGNVNGDVVLTPGFNRSRLPAYHRADIGLTKTGVVRGVGDYELRLQAINAYSRRNIWFNQVDFENSPVDTPVRMLPFLPNVSLTVDF